MGTQSVTRQHVSGYLLACTGHGRFLPPSPRCGDRLEGRVTFCYCVCLAGPPKPCALVQAGPGTNASPPGWAILVINSHEWEV